MLALLADENFNARILRGITRSLPALDVVRAVDVGLAGLSDAEVLEWAAKECRVLVTHDSTTISAPAFRRVTERLAMPGVVIVPGLLPIGDAIQELLLLITCGRPDDLNGLVIYLPLK